MTRAAGAALAALAALLVPGGAYAAGDAAHQRLLTLDTHLDTPASLDLPGWSILDRHDVAVDYTQVDVPRMKSGGLDGGFWAIYTPQGPLDAAALARATHFALDRGLAIRNMVDAHPGDFGLALSAADAARIAASNRRIVYLSIENAYPLGEDGAMLGTFHKMGVRLLGFAHFANNQFADSSTDKPKWNGLSPAGKALLAEANRLGIMLDASHSSDLVLDQMLELSRAPIVLSHSGCKSIYDHPRNIDDDRLRALAAKGGVIQINAYGAYLRKAVPNPARDAAMRALFTTRGEGAMTAAAREAMLAKRRAIDAQFPDTDRPTLDDVMAHMLHALKVAGPDHVGIGLDWDGGGGVKGMEDVASIAKITVALRKAGYTGAQIGNIWSGNVLRVMRAAEKAAQGG